MRYLLIPIALLTTLITGCIGNKDLIVENTNRPNIIYILADDMGYGDVGAMYNEG